MLLLLLLFTPDYVCGGELFTHLHQIGPFAEEQARVYAAEVTLALEHLHNVSNYVIAEELFAHGHVSISPSLHIHNDIYQ